MAISARNMNIWTTTKKSSESATHIWSNLHIADKVRASMLALEALRNDVLVVKEMCLAVETCPYLSAVQIRLEKLTHTFHATPKSQSRGSRADGTQIEPRSTEKGIHASFTQRRRERQVHALRLEVKHNGFDTLLARVLK